MDYLKQYNKWLGNPIMYLKSMSVYHAILILLFMIGITTDSHQFYKLTFLGSGINLYQEYTSTIGLFSIGVITLILFTVDALFLIIMMYEFKWMRLNYKKLFALEICILSISAFIPIIREIMLFLSINSIAIYIIYRIFMQIPIFGTILTPLFNISAFMFIVKLIVWEFVEFIVFVFT